MTRQVSVLDDCPAEADAGDRAGAASYKEISRILDKRVWLVARISH
jgi:hypothetical protein